MIGNFWMNLVKHTERSWDRVTEIIKKRDNYVCRYCGVFDIHGGVDHILPLAKGGTDAIYNLVWSCSKCNSSKGDKTLREWVEFLADSRKEESIKMIHDFLQEYERIPESLLLSVAKFREDFITCEVIMENDVLFEHPEIDRMIDALEGLHKMLLLMQGLPESMLLAAEKYEELMHAAFSPRKQDINDMTKFFIEHKDEVDTLLRKRHPSLSDKDSKEAIDTARGAFEKFVETLDIDLDDDTKRQLKLL